MSNINTEQSLHYPQFMLEPEDAGIQVFCKSFSTDRYDHTAHQPRDSELDQLLSAALSFVGESFSQVFKEMGVKLPNHWQDRLAQSAKDSNNIEQKIFALNALSELVLIEEQSWRQFSIEKSIRYKSTAPNIFDEIPGAIKLGEVINCLLLEPQYRLDFPHILKELASKATHHFNFDTFQAPLKLLLAISTDFRSFFESAAAIFQSEILRVTSITGTMLDSKGAAKLYFKAFRHNQQTYLELREIMPLAADIYENYEELGFHSVPVLNGQGYGPKAKRIQLMTALADALISAKFEALVCTYHVGAGQMVVFDLHKTSRQLKREMNQRLWIPIDGEEANGGQKRSKDLSLAEVADILSKVRKREK